MRKKIINCCSAAAALALSLSFAAPASANSAQTHWEGTTSTGAIVSGASCPLVVEQEVLTFSVPSFPQEYYRTAEEFLAYNGSVTAAYTFYNPTDYQLTASLLFPFGTLPDYGHLRDQETNAPLFSADTEKYDVTVDGVPIEKTLRHSLTYWGEQFSLERDLARLRDGFAEDAFYAPDLPVTRYTYLPTDVDFDAYPAASAAFVLRADASKTRVLMEEQSGGSEIDGGVMLECWVDPDDPIVVNVIGEPLAVMPEWKFYENGACEKEIPGTMILTNTEQTTLKDLLLTAYDPSSGVLEYDWYNALVMLLKDSEWDYGAISGTEFRFDLSDRLMRWYAYEITLAPGERIVNTVTAPIYPAMNTAYEPPVYTYTYLLSPAKTWADFNALDIRVDTPYFMIDSAEIPFVYENPGYSCHLDGLPEGELVFTLSEDEAPQERVYDDLYFPGNLLLLVGVGLGILVLTITAAIHRKR